LPGEHMLCVAVKCILNCIDTCKLSSVCVTCSSTTVKK
jgi:hypothetical protein